MSNATLFDALCGIPDHRTKKGRPYSARFFGETAGCGWPPDSGEVIEVLELLKNLPLEGAVITGDAAFSFESVVEAIRDGGGDYFLFVKGNQPELKSEIAHAFGDVSPLKGDV